jgi:hypothetical protein
MNTYNSGDRRGPKQAQASTQEVLKRYESERENKLLLKKMLQIMERPLISKQTSFQPKAHNATIHQRSRPQSGASSKSKGSRIGSARSSSRAMSPSTGMGPASLNNVKRKESAFQIQKQNLRMVNNLLLVKPEVPMANDLKRWNNKHDSIKKKITQVRYGTPKPYQQIQIRINSALRRSSGSQASND